MGSPDKRKQAIREHRQWLENFGWAWYVRLKIRASAVTDAQMKELFYEWISQVERVHGDTGFRWAFVLEHGPTRRSRQFHVLIGGLRNMRKDLAGRWNFMGGDAVIDRYDPDEGGIPSMLKTMDDNGCLDIDSKLPMIPGVWAPTPITDRSDDEAPDPKNESAARLRVANIADDTSPGDLRRLFSKCGRVSDVWIHSSPRYRFALVDIARDGAAEAVEWWNGRRWRGRELRVEQAGWGDTPQGVGSFDSEDEDTDITPP